MIPDLDQWIAKPAMRICHARSSSAPPERLWEAAQRLRLRDAGTLGRLIRWRIPGLAPDLPFGQMFREPPFTVLEESEEGALVAGLVGRIWTLRRDYPNLAGPEQFRSWSARGTARVVFASWVRTQSDGGSELVSETRVEAIGVQGRLGVRAVRPLVRAFQHRIASDGIVPAVRRAERAR